MTDDLRPRLEAVERAVADGETDLSTIGDAATLDARLTAVEERLATLETQLSELDATTQAMRGYLSGVDGVTDDVERQATLALAKAERIEQAVFEADDGLSVERLPAPSGESHSARSPSEEASSNDAFPSDPPTDDTTPSEHDTQHTQSPSLVTRLRDAL